MSIDRYKRVKYAFLIMLLLLSFGTHAEIYKWVDKSGRVHYSDSNNKADNQTAEKVDLKINTYKHTSFEDTEIFTKKVVMYSASWCGYCKKARRYFIAKGLPFAEYDIERNKSARRQYKKLGAKAVPVILYKGRRMNGFTVKGFNRIYQDGK